MDSTVYTGTNKRSDRCPHTTGLGKLDFKARFCDTIVGIREVIKCLLAMTVTHFGLWHPWFSVVLLHYLSGLWANSCTSNGFRWFHPNICRICGQIPAPVRFQLSRHGCGFGTVQVPFQAGLGKAAYERLGSRRASRDNKR